MPIASIAGPSIDRLSVISATISMTASGAWAMLPRDAKEQASELASSVVEDPGPQRRAGGRQSHRRHPPVGLWDRRLRDAVALIHRGASPSRPGSWRGPNSTGLDLGPATIPAAATEAIPMTDPDEPIRLDDYRPRRAGRRSPSRPVDASPGRAGKSTRLGLAIASVIEQRSSQDWAWLDQDRALHRP